MGCSTPARLVSIPIPPRPVTAEWQVGVTNAPFTPAEWQLFPWQPLWRVSLNQAAAVTARTSHVLLLAGVEDDTSVMALLPFSRGVWGIELGNEPDLSRDCHRVNAWYGRMVTLLRTGGFTGHILTAGIGNIDDASLTWGQCAMAGLPADVVFGWHAYAAWQGQLGKLLAILQGRPHAMTESGYPQPDAASEQTAATQTAAALVLVKAAGALTYIDYQMHDDLPGRPASNFGVMTLEGRVRPILPVLQNAR